MKEIKELSFVKVENGGKVAVLYSPGFGAGWESWNSSRGASEFLLMDSRLVEMAACKASADEVSAYLASNGLEDVYVGGWEQIRIEWVSKGDRFEIHEYDGNESVRVFGPVEGFLA